VDLFPDEKSPEALPALHPDGIHWAVTSGNDGHRELLIGKLTTKGFKLERRIQDENMPERVRFAQDGTLYTGNRNGTLSIYRDR
jgi:hypothetical protein